MLTASRWHVRRSLCIAVIGLLVAAPSVLCAGTRPHYGGTLRVETHIANWQQVEWLHALVFETLTSIDARGQAQPLLALRWDSQNGARHWVFTLRPRVHLHDGSLLTADDVARSLSAAHCLGCERRTIRASGDTVVIESDQPMQNLPEELALARFAVSKTGDQGVALGSGPFRIAKTTSTTATLEAFDQHWQGRPFLDAVEIMCGRAPREQLLDLGVGRAEVVEVPAESLKRTQQEHLRVLSSRDVELIAVVATGTQDDPRLRQALAATADRSALLSFLFQKQGEVSAALLPNWLTGYGVLFPAAPDLGRARDLRAQVGGQHPLTLSYPPGDATLQLVAERLALNARESGLQVQLAASSNGNLRVVRLAMASPNLWVSLAEYAASAESQLSPDENSIEDLYRNERELVGTAKIIPLLYLPRSFAVSERVHGLRADPFGRLDLANAWLEAAR